MQSRLGSRQGQWVWASKVHLNRLDNDGIWLYTLDWTVVSRTSQLSTLVSVFDHQTLSFLFEKGHLVFMVDFQTPFLRQISLFSRFCQNRGLLGCLFWFTLQIQISCLPIVSWAPLNLFYSPIKYIYNTAPEKFSPKRRLPRKIVLMLMTYWSVP